MFADGPDGAFIRPQPGLPERSAYWTCAEVLIDMLSIPLATTGQQLVTRMMKDSRPSGVSPQVWYQSWRHLWTTAEKHLGTMGLNMYQQCSVAMGCRAIARPGRINVYKVLEQYQMGKLPTQWVVEDLVQACETRHQQDAYLVTQITGGARPLTSSPVAGARPLFGSCQQSVDAHHPAPTTPPQPHPAQTTAHCTPGVAQLGTTLAQTARCCCAGPAALAHVQKTE